MAKIGIDFGSSFTTMSYVNQQGVATPIRVHGKEKIPTMLYFPEDGSEPLIGEAAYNKYQDCMDVEDQDSIDAILGGIITGLKHEMSHDSYVATPYGNKSYVEVIAIFLAYLKKYAEEYEFSGEAITDVCMTYPVSFDWQPEKKDILQKSAIKAGFKNVRLLKEPVAALMGCENRHDIKNEGVLIYDFGGGTFDVAYMMFDYMGQKQMLPPVGDGECGGQNIDMALYDNWNRKIRKEKQRDISMYENEVFLPILKSNCVKQKEKMSNGMFGPEYLPLPPAASVLVRLKALSMQEWNDIVEPWVDKTIAKTRQMLETIDNHNKEDGARFSIDKVILIGGSSRLPMVYEKLKEICPVTPTHVPEVDVAVANGAAIFASKDEIGEEPCFCIYCGDKITNKYRYCTNCGKANYRYNHCFDDV